jgi:hypothetical protein
VYVFFAGNHERHVRLTIEFGIEDDAPLALFLEYIKRTGHRESRRAVLRHPESSRMATLFIAIQSDSRSSREA